MADTGRKQRIGRPPTVSREEIIKAALGEGISKFSMLSVAKRLNITHGALYRYFPSRDELAIAAVDTVIERACWDDTATVARAPNRICTIIVVVVPGGPRPGRVRTESAARLTGHEPDSG